MEMKGEKIIFTSKQKVWEALNDPEILKKAIPGCEEFIKNSDTAFSAKAINIPPWAIFAALQCLSKINAPWIHLFFSFFI